MKFTNHKKSLVCCILLLAAIIVSNVNAHSSFAPAPLFGTDALGRPMPEQDQVRPFRGDRYVGIFYFLWLHQNKVYDNSKILAAHPGAYHTTASPPWGPKNYFHFWGEPLFGYYRSDDPWVIRRHCSLLSDAGVDFLIFDTTNSLTYDKEVLQLCKIFEEQRKQGEHVPQFTFMVNSNARRTADKLYNLLYKSGQYKELWFYWQGKPLLICDPAKASDTVQEFFTLRKAHWPFTLVNTENAWHWEATYPQVYSYDKDPSKPEQVNVSVGQNLHQDTGQVEWMSTGLARGRSYHKGKNANDQDAYKYGYNFEEQWQRAYELDPNVVMITGWNEWIAMQLNKTDTGPVGFCDQYNREMSRDVEMMAGGYGDNYYLQMAANIRKYKGMSPQKRPSSPKTINILRGFDQWDDVEPEYTDHIFDTTARDHKGCGDYHYTVETGRNDFVTLKVTRDALNLYFYVETAEPISPHTDDNWMWLFIDVIGHEDRQVWEGFDYVINRGSVHSDKGSIEICDGAWNWTSVGRATFRVAGNKMQLSVPKRAIGITGDAFCIEFKWIDNCQKPGDIMDVYINGDAAPDSRFRYRYDVQ